MFLRKLPATLSCLSVLTAATFGLHSTIALAQSQSVRGLCTKVLNVEAELRTRLTGSDCNPNVSEDGCRDAGVWSPMTAPEAEIGITRGRLGDEYWYLDDKWGNRGWIDTRAVDNDPWVCRDN
jgi:hypothetical protein